MPLRILLSSVGNENGGRTNGWKDRGDISGLCSFHSFLPRTHISIVLWSLSEQIQRAEQGLYEDGAKMNHSRTNT
jgi:hypothetical protein